MAESADVLVVGAGPAGIGAALEAAARGLEVVVIDEAAAAGGQVYRPMPEGFRAAEGGDLGPDHATGERLRAALAASRARTAFGQRAWLVAPGFRVETARGRRTTSWRGRALILATGATERVFPVHGWTTPGVIGLAAATVLLKSQSMLPGRATVVAGCGPLVAAVAAGIVKGGGRVAALVDLASPATWLRAMPAMAVRPALLRRGLGWLRQIRASGTPLLFGHGVSEVRGGDAVAEVVVRPVDAEGRPRDGATRTFTADSLALGHGLVPSTEASRLIGARHAFDALMGGWVPLRDEDGRTSVPFAYAAGDGAGIRGAEAALVQGRLAGLAAAVDLGALDRDAFANAAGPLRRERRRAERFGAVMSRMMAPRPGLVSGIAADTLVCRCEDLTRGEIEQAITAGAYDVNQLKSWTRCGMGPCQGRVCGETAAALMAAKAGSRETAGQWTARVPIRPVAFDTLVGAYDYADIPQPVPAH